jgi:hypothetical protein
MHIGTPLTMTCQAWVVHHSLATAGPSRAKTALRFRRSCVLRYGTSRERHVTSERSDTERKDLVGHGASVVEAMQI